MLPFLKKPRQPNLIVEQRKSDNPNESSEMEACAKDLLDAIEAKDIKGMAAAMKAACEIAESLPHEEYGDSE